MWRTHVHYINRGGELMFLALALLLALAWLTGFGVMHVASTAIHVLIVLAIVSLVVHLFRGRTATS